MDPQHSPSSESRGAKAAPFAYGGRRQPVFGAEESAAEAARATRSSRRVSAAAQERHRLHGRRTSRLGGPALDMTTAVHERARLSCILDGDLLQLAVAAASAAAAEGRSISASLSASPQTPSLSLPPLHVDPVPGCLRSLRYTRSARAWDTLASGCLAEAAHLSEKDNDVVAWAACFILSGSAQRGLVLLESYVVATCVVIHEVLTGVLGRMPKGINPFSKRRDGGGTGEGAVRDDSDNPYVRRKCLERHNQVLVAWMRYRSTFSEKPPAELANYDVNASRTSEAVVRQVVLQSMQLVDAVEVHRWYIVALMLYAPTDTDGSTEAAAGDGTRRRSRRTRGAGATADERGTPTNSVVDRDGDTDSIFAQSRSVHGGQSATADEAPAKKHTSASDGYRAPQNLWFRYFFALDDSAGAAARDDHGGKNAEDTGKGLRSGGVGPTGHLTSSISGTSGASAAVLTAFEARTRGTTRQPASSSSRQSAPGQGAAATSKAALNAAGVARAPPVAQTGSSADKGRVVSRTGSFAFQPGGKLARTFSWIRDRGRSSSHLTRSLGSFSIGGGAVGGGVSTLAAPTWHLSATVSLDQEQTCSRLLAHREEWDVYFITAMTAFYTHHYRTCMMAASRFLHWAETSGGLQRDNGQGGPLSSPQQSQGSQGQSAPGGGGAAAAGTPTPTSLSPFMVPGLQHYQRRFAVFVRAWAALQIGERLQAGKDILALLEEKEDSLSYQVGCALGLYGLPLPQAKEHVLSATHHFTNAMVRSAGPSAPAVTSFSKVVQGYLYLLTEAVHATTLLQLGLVHQTIEVAKVALQRAERCGLTEEDTLPLGALRDVTVFAATAMEDANTVLDIPLSPHRLVYIAVCPAFFGGLSASGIRVKAHSATHRILYPQNLPLYASTRQVVPFHMNRAMFLFHAGQIESAWDDACCAVAAVDEVAGSAEFAYSDCFSLRVYHFAIKVGLMLLETLLAADLQAAKACLANPTDQKAIDEKDAKLLEDELLSKEIVHICQDIVQRMQHFFPHSRVTALCRAQISIVCGGKDYLAHAVALSRRFPDSPAAQNVLTLALYFDHHIPEAVDNARRNLQTFPHSSDVILIHHTLQEKHVTYDFNYRKLLPIRYKPGSHDRIFTKRMIIVLILLAANLVVLCLTAFVNVPSVTHMPDGLRSLAVRMQLPTVAPLFFAAIFVIHAILAAVTTKNLIATLLTDLFFVNTPLNRALFCLRCIPLVNLFNAVLVSALGNNFLFESGSATFVLYFFLTILFVPFTTRIWFLPSIDEPDVGFMSWLAILGVDTVIAFFVVVPHIIAAFVEPYMLVLFYFFAPAERPASVKGFQPPSSSIRRRLLLHAHDGASMPQRFTTGSGSRFVHILVLKWLYIWSHCSMETRFLAEAQLEAECYRVFPLVEGEEAEVLFAHVSPAPLCAAITAEEEEASHAAGWLPGRTPAQPPTGDSQEATGANASGTRHRPRRASASLSSSSSSLPSSASSSDSRSASSSGSSDSSSGSDDATSRSGESASEDDDSEFDGTMLAGVRTVDAMRQLLNRTSRDLPQTMRHTASFVRPNMLQSLGSTLLGGSSHRANRVGSESDTDEEDAAAEERGGTTGTTGTTGRLSGTHHIGSTGREAVNGGGGGDDFRGGDAGARMAATLGFSEDIFGPNVRSHRPPSTGAAAGWDGNAEWQRLSDSYSSSNGSDASDVASHHADEAYDLTRQRGRATLRREEDAAAFSHPSADEDTPHTPVEPDSNYLYTDDYAEQNGFGWYAYDAAN